MSVNQVEPFSVAILTASSGSCRIEYTHCLVNLVAYLFNNQIFPDRPQHFFMDAAIGSEISGNYHFLVSRTLAVGGEKKFTHFLFIEDDMIFAPDCLTILARRNVDIVGANYSTTKGETKFMAIGLEGQECVTKEDSTGIEEVSLLPQGFTLVSRKVFETLEVPWFMNGYNPEADIYVSQDFYFSDKARKAGFKVYVDHDCSKKICHIGPKIYTWKDALEKESWIKGVDTSSLQKQLRLRARR